MNVVVRPLDNPLIDDLVEHRRALSGNILLSKRDFARSILHALRANQPVGILVDQNSSAENGAFVPFFGMPACANLTFAKLAARSGAAVIPGFLIWSEGERQLTSCRFYPEIEMTGDAALDTVLRDSGRSRRGSGDPRDSGPVALDTPPMEDTPRWRTRLVRLTMRFSLGIAAFTFLVASAGAQAAVADSSAGGFTVKVALDIQASPDEVYGKLVRNIGDWWNPDHTFSGNSHNLTIEEKPMGCFCEKLPKGEASGTWRSSTWRPAARWS